MAKQYNDVTVTIGTATLTDHAIRCTVELTAANQESTAFGDSWVKKLGGGLKSGSITLDFHQDFATGSVNPVIAAAFGGTANVIIGAAGTATAGIGTAVCSIEQLKPVDGAVGDIATVSYTWPTAGNVVGFGMS